MRRLWRGRWRRRLWRPARQGRWVAGRRCRRWRRRAQVWLTLEEDSRIRSVDEMAVGRERGACAALAVGLAQLAGVRNLAVPRHVAAGGRRAPLWGHKPQADAAGQPRIASPTCRRRRRRRGSVVEGEGVCDETGGDEEGCRGRHPRAGGRCTRRSPERALQTALPAAAVGRHHHGAKVTGKLQLAHCSSGRWANLLTDSTAIHGYA